ncbi:MAG: putative porin [Pseudomonadota bacterium]
MSFRLSTLLTMPLPVLVLVAAMPAAAQPYSAASRVEALERELAAQKDRISRLEALVERQNAALDRLAPPRQMAAGTPVPNPSAVPAPPAAAPGTAPPPPLSALAVIAPPTAAQLPIGLVSAGTPSKDAFRIPGLDVSGDVRVREEFNWSDDDVRSRTRSVLRARLRATYQITRSLSVGGQIATGDPDDPNSTDVTLTGFDDDLEPSLDQAWIRYKAGGLTAYAGKFPNLFQRTDMIWDGDVVPEGAGASYSVTLGDRATFDARATYFIIDEAPAGRDSDMLGFQGVLQTPIGGAFRLMLAGAYYDYSLLSVAGADAGDFRSNLIVAGRYLSDFRLINGLAVATWTGLGERWPLSLTGDYVRNLGARVSADQGFNIEFSAGRTAHKGDWRLFYNYSEVGVDAVFAAFSHDNLGIATNYRMHGASVGYVPAENLLLDATFYHYRPLDSLYAGANQPHDWLNRVRLNMMLSF